MQEAAALIAWLVYVGVVAVLALAVAVRRARR